MKDKKITFGENNYFDAFSGRYGSHSIIKKKKNNFSNNNYYLNKESPDSRHANAKEIKKLQNNTKALNKALKELYFHDDEYKNISFIGVNAERVNFVFSDLRNCDFSNAVLADCNFTFANLENCNFAGASLSECIFRHSNIQNCNFTDTKILFCDFTGAVNGNGCL